ncbi:hypothetical protein CC79DRAFT_1400224 [Sarocladium strictum]
MGRYRDRTFTGCWTCRKRKVKCDETKPVCRPCQRLKLSCSGYGPKLVWVDDEGQMPRSSGRRELRCETTWNGYPLLSSEILDLLIERCDSADALSWSSDQQGHIEPQFSPFASFPVVPEPSISPLDTELTDSDSDSDSNSEPDIEPESEPEPLPELDLLLQPLPSLSPLPDASSAERELFHHYVSHVSGMMLPYEHPRNVWKTEYPAIALSMNTSNQRALYSAILAQAAFNVAHLCGNDPKLLSSASKYYDRALSQLQLQIGHQGDFPGMLAPIMTLLFAEIYNGQSKTWRHHFQGAWTLLREYYLLEPWKQTDAVCVSIQSLNIIRIIGSTSRPQLTLDYPDSDSETDPTDTTIFSSVFQTPEFGFTIGASPDILKCIAEIAQYKWMTKTRENESLKNEKLVRVLQVLNNHGSHTDEAGTQGRVFDDDEDQTPGSDLYVAREQRLQADAFLHATYIYLYRTLLRVPPVSVKEYVSKTFTHISAFWLGSNGNFSLWPAFIAAVEAYTDEDMAMAGEWLDWATSFGIAGRDSIRRVVEEVWRRRDEIADSSGFDRGMIAIDWLDVMHEVDGDILLV